MYFADLSPYEYLDQSTPMLNVGWLDAVHAIPTGHVSDLTRDALVELAREPKNLTRGYHYCQLCDEDSPILARRTDEGGEEVDLGNGEIHVNDGGDMFAAPTMIIHYIDAHSYLPPARFVRALEHPVGTSQP